MMSRGRGGRLERQVSDTNLQATRQSRTVAYACNEVPGEEEAFEVDRRLVLVRAIVRFRHMVRVRRAGACPGYVQRSDGASGRPRGWGRSPASARRMLIFAGPGQPGRKTVHAARRAHQDRPSTRALPTRDRKHASLPPPPPIGWPAPAPAARSPGNDAILTVAVHKLSLPPRPRQAALLGLHPRHTPPRTYRPCLVQTPHLERLQPPRYCSTPCAREASDLGPATEALSSGNLSKLALLR